MTTTLPEGLDRTLRTRGLELDAAVISYAVEVHRLGSDVAPATDPDDMGREFTEISRTAQDRSRTVADRHGLSNAVARSVRLAVASYIVNGPPLDADRLAHDLRDSLSRRD